MLQTAYGRLFNALQLKKGGSLPVRSGTIPDELAAAAIAGNHRAVVVSTRRSLKREGLLRGSGMSIVVVNNGREKQARSGVSEDLELIGTTTLLDSAMHETARDPPHDWYG